MADEEKKLLALMEAMFNGQKRTLGMVEAAIEKFNSVEIEITKLNRKMNGLHDITVRQHSETSGRLDAISARLDETERLLDDRARDLARTQIDLAGQYNDVLTALRDSAHASRSADELGARLADVENKIAHL
ncbi:hypothetical protein QTL95_19690 [Rhizobium sp. S152]|uniref:hypothetical protein n=1 Tax=Rhizobium sp. S152 TaxID=3055038 RepID=UPI0025A98727|nr:hypothetical protein [Rhizobium sp. S152]MDM9628119.1 hypothetical protein [Rhizobium sp. S152]